MKKIMSVVLALILVSVMSVSAFASVSPTAPVEKDYDGGTVTYEKDPDKDNEYTFTATSKDGYNFIGWEIEGNYEIVSGSLDGSPITIRLPSGVTFEDVYVEPVFKKVKDKTTTKKDDDKKSPGTGDSMALAVLAVAALGGIVVSKKRLSK